MNAGECIGKMSGIRKKVGRRSASVVAHSDIKLVEIYEQALEHASETCQRCIDKSFLELLANRLAAAREPSNSKAKLKTNSVHADIQQLQQSLPDNGALSERKHVLHRHTRASFFLLEPNRLFKGGGITKLVACFLLLIELAALLVKQHNLVS